VFSTNEPCDRATIHAAVESGASAYVVDGIQPEHVRSIVDSDVVQFESFQALRIELEETRTALEDHNVIEKAKGLIMRHESCDEDTAHRMLAPMPLSMSLAEDRPRIPIVVGMVLSRNGITLSNTIYNHLITSSADLDDPIATASALIQLARSRGEPIRLASLSPWSCHDLQLRDWLASAGPDAQSQVQIVPVSPVQMADTFRAGAVEGCCVGEP
jgi:hypothetical protein